MRLSGILAFATAIAGFESKIRSAECRDSA